VEYKNDSIKVLLAASSGRRVVLIHFIQLPLSNILFYPDRVFPFFFFVSSEAILKLDIISAVYAITRVSFPSMSIVTK